MAISFVSSSSEYSTYPAGPGGAVTIDKSGLGSIQSQDILIAICKVLDLGGAPADPTLPTGFTIWYTRSIGTDHKFQVGWKRATEDDEPTGSITEYDFACSNSEHILAAIGVWRGCPPVGDPLDVSSDTPYVTSNTTVRAAGVTTSVTTSLVYAGFALANAFVTPPSGMTVRELIDNGVGDNERLMLADKLTVSAGPTGDKDGTTSTATPFKHAFLLALIDEPLSPPNLTLVTPADEGLLQGLTPTFVFGVDDVDADDIHIEFQASAFADFRSFIIDTDSTSDYADWEEAGSPFTSWATMPSGGATTGNRIRYTGATPFRYDVYYGRVRLYDGYQLSVWTNFSFTISIDATAALAVTIGGLPYNVHGLRIVEATGGEASPITFGIPLTPFLANPIAKGDPVAISSGLGGWSRSWNATVEKRGPKGTLVHIYCLQDDAYFGRKLATGDEASADIGQNLLDLVNSYGTPLTGTAIDTSTGVSAAIVGAFKNLREHFRDAVKSLPNYLFWADSGADVHFVDQADLGLPIYRVYKEDPSAY